MAGEFQPIKMIVKRSGDTRFHTFVSSFTHGNIANATHIVESANKLVIIDGQFLVPWAEAFREYADSLRKPIDRMYLSHRHPDHWFGLAAAFANDDVQIPIYALPETISFIEEHGDEMRDDHEEKFKEQSRKFGRDVIPSRVVVPQHAVAPGEELVDGNVYVFDRVVDTEIDYHLTIGLPELGVFIAQDLIYSHTHLYLTKDMEHWFEVLQDFLLAPSSEPYEIILPGHGLPASKNEVARNMEYLSAAKEAVADGMTKEAFKDYLLQRYPERKCPGILDIYLPRLFDGARDY